MTAISVQKALRNRLIGASAVTDLVPASAIFDRTIRPEDFPCVVIGEGQTMWNRVSYGRRVTEQHFDLHIWTAEDSTARVKAIAAAAAEALAEGVGDGAGYREISGSTTSCRYMRDPAARHQHAVLSFQTVTEETL